MTSAGKVAGERATSLRSTALTSRAARVPLEHQARTQNFFEPDGYRAALGLDCNLAVVGDAEKVASQDFLPRKPLSSQGCPELQLRQLASEAPILVEAVE